MPRIINVGNGVVRILTAIRRSIAVKEVSSMYVTQVVLGDTCYSSLDCGGSNEYCASNNKCQRERCTPNSDCD